MDKRKEKRKRTAVVGVWQGPTFEPEESPHGGREDWSRREMPTPSPARSLLTDAKLQVGPCLMVDAYLERNPVRAILDSGAGVSIVGKRFVALYGQTFGHPPPLEPIALIITGVNSAAALAATAETSFLLSFGSQAKPHKVSAVGVPSSHSALPSPWTGKESQCG